MKKLAIALSIIAFPCLVHADLRNPAPGSVTTSSTNTWTGSQTFSSATVTTLNVGSITSTTTAVGLMTNSCGYILGSFVQIVSSTSIIGQTITSASFANATNWNAAITPKCATDKFRVTWVGPLEYSLSNIEVSATLKSGSNDLANSTGGLMEMRSTDATETDQPVTLFAIDTPATLSSITYGLFIKSASGGVVICGGGNIVTCRMFVEEIAQ